MGEKGVRFVCHGHYIFQEEMEMDPTQVLTGEGS